MYAGKSTELQRLIRRHRVAERACCVIKYGEDTRYVAEGEALLATHDGATIPALPYTDLAQFEASEHFAKAEVIGIDEGQFFTGIAERVDRWVHQQQGKLVIVTVLSSTFERKPWPEVSLLSAVCTDERRLSAVCALCKGEAPFTERTSDEKEEKVIGGKEKYRAVCGACYKRNKAM